MTEESENETEPLLENAERPNGVTVWGAIFIGKIKYLFSLQQFLAFIIKYCRDSK